MYKKNGTWSVWWRDEFIRIFTVAFDRLFKVRVGKGKLAIDCPAGLEPPQGLEIGEKLV